MFVATRTSTRPNELSDLPPVGFGRSDCRLPVGPVGYRREQSRSMTLGALRRNGPGESLPLPRTYRRPTDGNADELPTDLSL